MAGSVPDTWCVADNHLQDEAKLVDQAAVESKSCLKLFQQSNMRLPEPLMIDEVPRTPRRGESSTISPRSPAASSVYTTGNTSAAGAPGDEASFDTPRPKRTHSEPEASPTAAPAVVPPPPTGTGSAV